MFQMVDNGHNIMIGDNGQSINEWWCCPILLVTRSHSCSIMWPMYSKLQTVQNQLFRNGFLFFLVDNSQFLLFSPLNSLLCHSFSYIIDSLFSNSSKSMCVLVNIAMKRFFYDLTKYPMIGNNDFLSFVNRKLHTHAHTHSHTYFILTL